MIRKTRCSFKKADWLAFQEECEAAFAEAGPEHESVQELATRFHQALEEASVRHIPRGARNQPRPWALDPELKEAVDARRAARRDLRSGDRSAKERWVEAKRRAASVERRVSQRQFREYVSTTLNKHQSLGRVHKTLKMWEGASDDQHRAAESMEDWRPDARVGPGQGERIQPHLCDRIEAAGTLCSSFRAEMVALQVTLDHILEHQRDAPEPNDVSDYVSGVIGSLPVSDHRLEEIRVLQERDDDICRVTQQTLHGWMEGPRALQDYFSVGRPSGATAPKISLRAPPPAPASRARSLFASPAAAVALSPMLIYLCVVCPWLLLTLYLICVLLVA
ncbi:hypothetical protein FJT64_017543 [Amphibalanus amphitrite]|uniref:Uncharacterized protein n=1 Tax=Amphibalanus amphitrite TaxID=1232801 RepID=A0A6A4XBE9_AMPAM|nr:hypothetical protein FJT64_017543 [Amphibalanus amphitrite]